MVHSPTRRPPAKMRKLPVDGIDQPTKSSIVGGMSDRRIVYSPERPRLEGGRRLSSDGSHPTKVCIVEGVKDRRAVHSPPSPPSVKSRGTSSHGIGQPLRAASAPITPAFGGKRLVRGPDESVNPDWVKSMLEDLVEEDPMDAPEFYGFCGGGAWIPNTPEPRYRPISTSPHRASSVDMHVGTGRTPRPTSSLSGMTPSSSSSRMNVSTQRDVICAEASSSFLRPDAMAYSTVLVWSSVWSFTGSDAPEVD